MSVGLALIFGMLNVISLVHGSFFMLGAFLGLTIISVTGSFWIALIAAPICVAVIAIVIELFFLRRMYNRGHLDQVLLTFGFTFVFADVVKYFWGNEIRSLPVPDALSGSVELFGGLFPVYRLFLIGFGAVVIVLLWLFVERSRLGAMVRASVDDRNTASGIGINVKRLFGGIFGFSAAMAALGGVIAGPILAVYNGMDAEILIPAFIVVVIGGMSSMRGAFVGSLLIGMVDTFGKAYFPSLALFTIYILMIVVLLTRPGGLLPAKSG
jgi:branched-subunit amino acid ABC-type transport system permease component